MSLIYWLAGGLAIAAILILLAVSMTGGGTDDIDPYNGDGF